MSNKELKVGDKVIVRGTITSSSGFYTSIAFPNSPIPPSSVATMVLKPAPDMSKEALTALADELHRGVFEIDGISRDTKWAEASSLTLKFVAVRCLEILAERGEL